MSKSGLSNIGEFGFIAQISSYVKNGYGVITGIGDDAAVTTLTEGMHLLTSTDMLIEDIHFRRSWHNPHLLGRKSLAVNISDIAAMGGIARWATLSLAIPKNLPLNFLNSFCKGFLEIASEHQITVIGGDTCSSKNGLTISVTIMGEQYPEKIIRRSSARVGDDIWISGTVGESALGLKIAENQINNIDENLKKTVLEKLLNPTPRAEIGRKLAEKGLITAMIDISDGIVSDFGHIGEESGCGGDIDISKVPVSKDIKELKKDYSELFPEILLTGGEDYELCFTAPKNARKGIEQVAEECAIRATQIGVVTEKEIRLFNGTDRYYCKKTGFNHFR